MMRFLFSLVLFFGITVHVAAEEIVIDFTHPKFALLDEEGKKLLSEYTRAYPKIKDFYGNLRVDVDVLEEYYPSEASLEMRRKSLEKSNLDRNRIEDQINRWRDGPVRTERQYTVRYRPDGYARVDSQVNSSESWVVHVDHSQGMPDLIPEVNVTLLTPTMGYALSHNGNPSNKYFSLNAKRNPKSSNAEDIGIPLIYFDSAPFCRNGTPLVKILLQSPPLISGERHMVIDYVRQREIEGAQIVEIRTSTSDTTLKHLFGEVTFYRDSWGIKETYSRSQVVSPGDSFGEIHWVREHCTYDGVVDGVPLLKTYQRSFGTCGPETQEETITRKCNFEVTKIVPGPVALSEFDVAQFLPPDVKIGEVTPAGLSPVRIAAIVIGIILIVLGLYFRILRMKKK